jgi:ElaA protein
MPSANPAGHPADDPAVRDALIADLDPRTLYRILALRSAVFVLEQDCVYLDQDGRDLEPDARQLWVERDGEVLATLRLLRDPSGGTPATEGEAGERGVARIGRVATAKAARGAGIAADLMRRALDIAGDGPVVLDAQSYLADWYGRFGFVRDGADFVEDGIPHIPMRRAATTR